MKGRLATRPSPFDLHRFASFGCKHLASLASLAAVLGAAGCVGRDGQARAQFSLDVACPEDRIAVTPVVRRAATPPEPPPEVAADPARLRLWRERDAMRDATPWGFSYVAVHGCGQKRVYLCSPCLATARAYPHCGTGPSCSSQGCSELPDQPGYISCDVPPAPAPPVEPSGP